MRKNAIQAVPNLVQSMDISVQNTKYELTVRIEGFFPVVIIILSGKYKRKEIIMLKKWQ